MNADQIRLLRAALLRDLYDIQPLGRRAVVLRERVRRQIACDQSDVDAALVFLESVHCICQVRPGQLAPGLSPFWFITVASMVAVEERATEPSTPSLHHSIPPVVSP